jgi:hypothetical protein
VSIPYRILFVLMTLRLLLPPGICVCKWNSPAARILVDLFQTGKDIPPPEPEDPNSDAPGCPASPFAVGMGLRPASPPPLFLGPAFETPPLLEVTAPDLSITAAAAEPLSEPPEDALYLTLRTLRI